MGKTTGFIEFKRDKQPYRPVAERRRDWHQVMLPWPVDKLQKQGARCMRVQAFIKEKCTAIHPVVEWRFRKAVLKGMDSNRAGDADDSVVEMGPIVFERIYPLYALSDIRGSSTQRSLAIQADLLTQLRLARDVIRWAHDARPLPGLHELLYRIDKHAAKIEMNLNSGDEVSTISFLRTQVESLFDHLQMFGPGVRERVEAYRSALDPRLGAVYDRRRLFEESVTRIADGISGYLDLEDQTAQTMFPHYFEKQKTDGVDHQIYVGASLLEDGKFDPLYLKSLRIWQLMRPSSRCRAARATSRARSSCSRVGRSARRLTRAQPRYCVLASSRRSAWSDSASAMISGTRSRFSRWSTTLSVRASPSSLTRRATSILRSKDRRPAMRSDSGARTSCTDTCTLSRPRARSPASRSRVHGMPLVIRLV